MTDLSRESLTVIKEIATLSAKTAAQEVADGVRAEVRTEMANLKSEMRAEIAAEVAVQFEKHFGTMTGSDHVIAHARMDRMFDSVENFSKGFWGSVAKKLGTVVLGALMFAAAYFITQKGGVPMDVATNITSGK